MTAGVLLFAGQRGVEQATAGEQNDDDADRGGDHVLRVPDTDRGDDADRVRVRAARENARVLREPRPAHHLQLPHGGERRIQLHAVLCHEPQVPAHAHDYVHAVLGGQTRAQRYASVVRQLPAVRHHGQTQHRGHADVRHRRLRQARAACRPGQQQQDQPQNDRHRRQRSLHQRDYRRRRQYARALSRRYTYTL